MSVEKERKVEEKVILYCKYYHKNQQEELPLTLVTSSGISHLLWSCPWKKIFPSISYVERCIWEHLFQWKKISSHPSWWTLSDMSTLKGTESSILQYLNVRGREKRKRGKHWRKEKGGRDEERKEGKKHSVFIILAKWQWPIFAKALWVQS